MRWLPTINTTCTGKPPSGTAPKTKPFCSGKYLIHEGKLAPLAKETFTVSCVAAARVVASSGKEIIIPVPLLELPLGTKTATMPVV